MPCDDVIARRAERAEFDRRRKHWRYLRVVVGLDVPPPEPPPPDEEPDDDIPEWEAALRKSAVWRAKRAKVARGRAPLLTARELEEVLP